MMSINSLIESLCRKEDSQTCHMLIEIMIPLRGKCQTVDPQMPNSALDCDITIVNGT